MKLKIKAAKGCTVHDHVSRESASGNTTLIVTDSPLWRRRIRAGFAVLVEEISEGSKSTAKKSTRKSKSTAKKAGDKAKGAASSAADKAPAGDNA